MGDLDTSMMLLLNKASRKMHHNSLAKDYVQHWLREAVETYDAHSGDGGAGSGPQWFLLSSDRDPDERAVFALALIDDTGICLGAGQGSSTEVRAFGQHGFPDDPRLILEEARKRFDVQERELSIGRDEVLQWRPGNQPGPGFAGTEFASLAADREDEESTGKLPVHPLDTELSAILAQAADGNAENRLMYAEVKRWLRDYFDEYAEELKLHPEEADEAHSDLLAADGTCDEDAVFVIALFDGESVRLAAGRGEVYAVRELGDDLDDALQIIAFARANFAMVDAEISFVGETAFNDWLDQS